LRQSPQQAARSLGTTSGRASTYVWLGQALLAPIAIFGWVEIADRVSSGEIAIDFSRPVDLQLAWWARDLGRASFQLLSRGLPPLLIGAITIGLALPQSWTAYPLGLISLILAVSISFVVRFLMNLIAFWTIDVRGFVSDSMSSWLARCVDCSFPSTSSLSGCASSRTPHPFPQCFRHPSTCFLAGR
jgi:ABC-type uncharacterized transport system permease subunit